VITSGVKNRSPRGGPINHNEIDSISRLNMPEQSTQE
jgi:hypothetical protein